MGCRIDRSTMWSVRCMHEAQMHDDNQFITLTYDDENLPHDGSLTPSHFTKFMKRYRKSLGSDKIRFYHGAEYGDKLGRPHHHALIFGHVFDDLELFNESEGIYTYSSPTLEKLWGHGFCTISDVTLASAAYVARYCLKKITGKLADDHYIKICPTTGEVFRILPEYSTMSRCPGIAKTWYDKYHTDIFPHDTTLYKGKNIKTPRYYENLLRSTDLPAFEKIKATRKEKAIIHQANNTPARLLVRETVKRASMRNLQRKLDQ